MKGILFKPEKIKFIRDQPEIEVQTRRLSGLKEINKAPDKWKGCTCKNVMHFYKMKPEGTYDSHTEKASEITLAIKPLYRLGEIVYIKEAWQVDAYYDGRPPSEIPDVTVEMKYNPTDISTEGNQHRKLTFDPGRWRSPLHLPARFARYFQKIIDVRAQRLQEIRVGEVYDEGCPLEKPSYFQDPADAYAQGDAAIEWYRELWNSINPDYPWGSNPWVFAYTMKFVSPEEAHDGK